MSEVHPDETFNPDEPVDSELLCAGCGYNLRGLTAGMQCPECGAPVARSLRGDFLRFGDPEWMRKIAAGTSLLRWSVLLSILLPMVSGVGAVILARRPAPGGATPAAFMLPILLASLIAGALWLYAAFLVTTQEPRVALQEDPVTLRTAIRYSATIAFAGQLVNVPAQLGDTALADWLGVAGTVLSLAGLVAFFGLFIYFRRFALRLPDARLAETTRTVMWGFVISYAVVLVGGLAAGITAITAAPGPAPGARGTAGLVGGGLFMCVGSVAMLVFVIWAYRLLLRYVKAFRFAAQEAQNASSWSP